MCAGSVSVGGTWVKFAVEKPPTEASDMVFIHVVVSGSLKSRRGYGAVGTERPSRLIAKRTSG